MKRVKIFMDPRNYDHLEMLVNSFLENLMPDKILDIQYQDCSNAASVLIVYEDERVSPNANGSLTARSFEDIYGGKSK